MILVNWLTVDRDNTPVDGLGLSVWYPTDSVDSTGKTNGITAVVSIQAVVFSN